MLFWIAFQQRECDPTALATFVYSGCVHRYAFRYMTRVRHHLKTKASQVGPFRALSDKTG